MNKIINEDTLICFVLSLDDYEISFKNYDGNEPNFADYREYYADLHAFYLQKGVDDVNSKVISYFFEGMKELVNGDILFWDRNYIDSQMRYAEGKKFIQRFERSRGIEAKLDILADRILQRIEGLIDLSQALQFTELNSREKLLSSALEHFNAETKIATEMGDTISAIVAYARALKVESIYWKDKSDDTRKEDTFEAKKLIMKSRLKIKQAAFIDSKNLGDLEIIENSLDDLTKERILVNAENLGNKAIMASEEGDYDSAKNFYQQAILFYTRASQIAADSATRRFLLSMRTVLEASVLEAEGNKAFKVLDDLGSATMYFTDAASEIDKAIALIGAYGNKELTKTFFSQKLYYEGMSKLATGVQLYDNEQYDLAIEIYEDARNSFLQAIEEANEAENVTIIDLGNRALNDIENYINMSKTLQ